MFYPRLIENLMDRLTRLPGIGRRSAERMVFWMLNQPKEDIQALIDAIADLKAHLMFCRRCHHLSDSALCPICSDQSRDQGMICIVEDPKDVIAIEKSGAYKGVYHVLLGTIAPVDGRGPENLTIQHLLNRVAEEKIQEVIIATDSDNEGEMTALYLVKVLKPLGGLVSRIGIGLPAGSSLEYADISTLSMSLTSRREVGV